MVPLFGFREDRFVGCKVGPHSCLYRHGVTIRYPDDVFQDRLLLSEFTHASSSPAFTIPAELLKLKTGMGGQMIPYKSTNEMMLSIAAGQTLFGFADPPIVIPLAQGGKVRALAMTGPSRLPELPDVPTVAEAGFGNIEIRLQWIGAFATAGTPPATVRMLEAAMRQVLADPAVRDKLKAVAYTPDGRSGEEFRQLIDADIRAYSDVVKAANLKFD